MSDVNSRACSRCGEVKPLSEFHKCSKEKLGVRSVCKVCRTAEAKVFYAENRESERERHREYALANPDVAKRRKRRWRKANPEKARSTDNAWKASNPDKVIAWSRQSYERKKNDLQFRLENAIKVGVHAGITVGSKASRSTFDLLGYSAEQLKRHLEAQFTDGMSWENYGFYGWHVDHIVPKSSFSYTTPDDPGFKEAWALSNLQPMWASENKSKGAKMDHPSTIAALAANDNNSRVEAA